MYAYTLYNEFIRVYHLDLPTLQGIYSTCMLIGSRQKILPIARLVGSNYSKYKSKPQDTKQIEASYNMASPYPFDFIQSWLKIPKQHPPRVWEVNDTFPSSNMISNIRGLGLTEDGRNTPILEVVTTDYSKYLSGILFADMILGLNNNYYIYELDLSGVPVRSVSFSLLTGFNFWNLPPLIRSTIVSASLCSWAALSQSIRKNVLPALACDTSIDIDTRTANVVDILNKPNRTSEEKQYVLNWIQCANNVDELLETSVPFYLSDIDIITQYTNKILSYGSYYIDSLLSSSLMNATYLKYLLSRPDVAIGLEPKYLKEIANHVYTVGDIRRDAGVGYEDLVKRVQRELDNSTILLLEDGREIVTMEVLTGILKHTTHPMVILDVIKSIDVIPYINRSELYEAIFRDIHEYVRPTILWLLRNYNYIQNPEDIWYLANVLLNMEWYDDDDIEVLKQIVLLVYSSPYLTSERLSILLKTAIQKFQYDQKIGSLFAVAILANPKTVVSPNIADTVFLLNREYSKDLYYIRILRAVQRKLKL